MPKPVFSLRYVFIATAVFAAALTLLLTANYVSSAILWNFLGIAFAAAIVAAIILRQERQAFFIGFVVWGVGYVIACTTMDDVLLTNTVVDTVYASMNGTAQTASYVSPVYYPVQPVTAPTQYGPPYSAVPTNYPPVAATPVATTMVPIAPATRTVDYRSVRQIGHGLFSLSFAYIGGLFARRLWTHAIVERLLDSVQAA